jgi:diguanylate cyclase (GGDEF)-like protein/PAS domain S-box-containing protein
VTPHQFATAAKPYSRLLAWRPFIAVALLLSILWGLVLGFAAVHEKRMAENARKQLRLLNNAADQQTRDLLRVTDGQLGVAQQWLARAPQLDASLGELLHQLTRHSDGLLHMSLVNEAGTSVSTPGAPVWAQAMPAVQLPTTTDAMHVGEPLRGSPSEPWRWPLTRRLATPVGEAAGLVAWIDLPRLGALHERLREEPAGDIPLTTSKTVIGALVILTLGGAVACWALARSQRATRHSQAQFEAVSNAFPLGLFMTDTRGETTYANDAYFKALGLPRERMAWGWSELFDAAKRDAMVAGWRDAAGRGTPLRNALHLRRPDGTQATYSVRIAPLVVDDQLIGNVGSLEDVTERVQHQRAQRMLTAIFERSTDIVAQVSPQGQLLYLNPAGRATLDLKPDDPIDTLRFDDFLPAHRELQLRDEIMPTALATGLWLGETSVLRGDGREIDVSEMLIVHRDDRQEIETYSVVMRDITGELRSRTELQRSESILKIVASTLPVMVAVADQHQHYLFTNDAFDRWVGRPHDRLAGLHARAVVGEDEYERRRPHIEAALAGERVMFEAALGGGQYVETTYIPFHDAEGKVAGLVAVSQDISGHKRQHQILLDASQTDPLTGISNRAGFDLRVGDALRRADEAGLPLALLMIDLDRFKPINDEYGHATGDALLVAVARRLQKVLRPSDLVARLGGDEFAVVLPEVRDEDGARTVARKIVNALGEPFPIDGKLLVIGASAGVALSRHRVDSLASLTQRADVALYRAKRSGRSCFEMASAEG